jgi:hypothetical protein
MTPARKKKFLDHLREHGLVIAAAKHASANSPLGCQTSFYEERSKDPEFAAAWEQALDESEEDLLRQLKKRGIDGIQEDVYGSQGQGMPIGVVGQKTVYSDKMAELYARVKSARIRQGLANKVELSGTVKTEASIGIDKLTPEQQDLLTKLLDTDDKAK